MDVVPTPAERLLRLSHPMGDPTLDLIRHALHCVQQALTSVTEAARKLSEEDGSRAGATVEVGTGAEQGGGGGSGNGHEHRLTGQERRVLTLIAAGLSNREIADALEISDKTAKNYVHTLLVKLDVSSRTEAAFTALCDHLVDQDECRRARERKWPVTNGGGRRGHGRTP
ncbi:DNA-binding NarL/FixJ family response regulator [Saccharothrix tamanrassetensis]|uniref:DNA-binding NarL/FixJ family response regulator n=1 Tax=Saccharothrix tamanrassetensis TaxID=1051531 RepID=A0A841CIP4_9PSEU|nr:LuxR C-terminal-related transcriptional regulator [Saccharothrix tamanrassetensis]MBB5957169.1 DNA-binding NarL/FixJ family response regulator [Saccharothrix tamanrassetensis]